ncbi:MAG: hypothetical protein IPL33_16130 [Sphingobacteriales bacterium]|nr:hypothetical protein [Sphingobacteriales bacterium]
MNVCGTTIHTYTVSAIAGSTYDWTVTGGTILSPMPYGNTIQVQWGTNGVGTVSIAQTAP